MNKVYGDTNWQQLKNTRPKQPGFFPRRSRYGDDMAVNKMGLLPIEDMAEIIKWEDLKERLNDSREQQMQPVYHMHDTWAPPGYRWNQNGLPYCTTEDTEVLTNHGWIGWPEYDGKTLLGTVNQFTHQVEFQRPLSRQVLEYDGEMIYSTNRRIDFGVTPNHRMYVRKWNEQKRTLNDSYDFVAAENLGWYTGLMHAPSGFQGTELISVGVPGDREYTGDDFLALLAAIISDGFAGGSSKTKNLVSFCCFTDKDYDRLSALAYRCGFKESPSRRGVWNRWGAGSLANWIRANCYTGELGAWNKRIPDIVKWTSERQIKLFLTFYHDQKHSSPMSMYYSTSKQCVDDLQELLLRIGKRSTLSWDVSGRSRKMCRLVVSDTDRLCLDKKKHIEQDKYKGLVYCATVPNGTLITRRNGSVLISGNCWTWSATAVMMTLEAMEAEEVEMLAPVSLGWLVGWRSQGYYLDDTIRGLRERGVTTAEMVGGNENSTNRRSSSYEDGWEEAALAHRLNEVWDIDTRNGDRNSILQAATCLCSGRPIYNAFNWWGHAVTNMGMRWDESKKNNVVWEVRNSHNEPDIIEMDGDRGVPDEMYAMVSSVLA